MDQSYDYSNKYSGKCVNDVDLKELKSLCDKLKKDGWKKGRFGLGIIQWTNERTATLVDQYLEEAKGAQKITLDQVIIAEGKMVMKELKSNQYKKIHDSWKSNNASNLNSENSAYNAGAQICLRYEVPYDKENQSVKRGNTAKTVYKIMIVN